MSNPSDNDSTAGFTDIVRQPAARSYLFIGLAALIVYYTQMFEPYGDLGTLLAVVIALPGLMARWVISPGLFLIITSYLLYDPDFDRLRDSLYGPKSVPGRYPRFTELGLPEILLAASILTYLIAQFRLLSLAHQSMPDDPPPRRKGQPEPAIPRRPAGLFADREIVLMFWLVPICVLAGGFAWEFIFRDQGRRLGRSWGIEQPFARLMLFAWIFITGAIVANVALRYLALRRMSRREARLLLQDMFWQETRREQERIYRWRRWQRQRRPDLTADSTSD